MAAAMAALDARSAASWCIKHIYVWLLLFLHVNGAVWNGCVGSDPLPGTWDCYKIHYSVIGYDAWKICKPLHIDLLQRVLDPEYHSKYHAEYPNKSFLWMGAIEEYPGSKTYIRYNQISKDLELGDAEDNASEQCLALNITSLKDMKFVRRNCNERFPIICLVQSKYIAHAYKASAPEACNNSRALSLLPLPGCFVINEDCYNYSVIVREQWIVFDNLTKIETSLPVVILQMNTEDGEYVNENSTLINSTTLCYIGHGSLKRINLRLKWSSGALRLWVGNPGRAEWPPECVGGEVHHARFADPRALLVSPQNTSRASMAHPIWCYTKDVVTGDIVVSNRVIIPGNNSDEISNTCPDTTSPTGPRPGTTINHNASCLNCFQKVLDPCVRDIPNCKLCTEEHCGPFGINISQWRLVHTKDGDFEDFRKCAERAQCAGGVLWKLSEGGDCDGDGAFDCDDRLLRVLAPTCNLTARDPRNAPQYQHYWGCRTQPLRDFVDLPKDNKIARYFCENYTNRRRWIGPEYIPPERSFYVEKEVEKTIEELHTLQYVTVKLDTNEILTMKETEEIISNFSRLFDVSDNVLRNAQRAAEVSSLPELLESILIKAPLNVSFTTANLAVSKKEAIGFQLISDKPLVGLETFGENPRQVPITSRDGITTEQVEAAVILPKIRKETSVVVVTFAKGSDFTSCKGPTNAKSQKENGTVSYRMSFEGSNPVHEPTLPSHTESVENEELKSESNCSYHSHLVRGCINTHVVQVGLLDGNGSYVQLPQGETVDILLRTKITPMLGQTKTCAYWKPQEGGWASDGCELIEGKEGVDICRCSHLTHFAQLVSDATVVLGPHKDRLNIMSMCACIMSLVGFAGIILAGVFSRRWREKTENQVMLNLAVAMSLFMGLFLWASLAPNPRAPLDGRCPVPEGLSVRCQAAGAALHYAVLCTFCWMLVAAVTHYLRFTTFTATDAVPHFVLKSSLVGWGAPVVPVVALAAAHPATYAGRGRDFCYPTGPAFYAAVLAPVLLVLLINLVVFVMILRVLFPRCCVLVKAAPRPQRLGYNERRDLVRRMIICVAFTFLFGVTWYLGLLSFTVWPAYVFCAFMALHGPALLLFFVFGEESIRTKLCGKKKRFGKSDESTSGFSGSTNSTNVLTMSTHTNTRGRTRIQVLPSTETYVVNGKNDNQKRSDIPGV